MDIRNYEDDLIIAAAATVVALVASRRRNLPSPRVHPYIKKRITKGRFATDFLELVSHPSAFKENFRMEPEVFKGLFQLVEPLLQPQSNVCPNENISPLEKFAVIIEYLASGTIQSKISKQHFVKIVDEVCSAICEALCKEIPSLSDVEFVRIANEFNILWSLPNCVGALGSKHVALKCPSSSAGNSLNNYKEFNSIVLMAITDANYKFVYIDVGAYGSADDANIFSGTRLGKDILEDNLPFPEDKLVGVEKIPHFFVADDAFPLKKRIVKPYAPRKPNKLQGDERIANYRINRAKRCVENAFGILSSKWICLSRTMFCSTEKARKIVSACCHLHNYLIRTNKASYCRAKYTDYYDSTGSLVEGEWRKQVTEHSLCQSTMQSTARRSDLGTYVRDKVKDFVNSPTGCIPWQSKAAYLE